jgi:hypothetical protein
MATATSPAPSAACSAAAGQARSGPLLNVKHGTGADSCLTELVSTDGLFLAFDGREAGSNGDTPFWHARCDKLKTELGISVQFDLVAWRAGSGAVPAGVPGRFVSGEPDFRFFGTGCGLWSSNSRCGDGCTGGHETGKSARICCEAALEAREAALDESDEEEGKKQPGHASQLHCCMEGRVSGQGSSACMSSTRCCCAPSAYALFTGGGCNSRTALSAVTAACARQPKTSRLRGHCFGLGMTGTTEWHDGVACVCRQISVASSADGTRARQVVVVCAAESATVPLACRRTPCMRTTAVQV